MKLPLPRFLRGTPRPVDPFLQRVRWYWRLMLPVILTPVAIGIPYLGDGAAAASILSFVAGAWQVYRYLVRSGRVTIPRILMGGMLTLAGTLGIAVIVSTVYVLRNGAAYAGDVGAGVELLGASYLVAAHWLIHRFTSRHWPDTVGLADGVIHP